MAYVNKEAKREADRLYHEKNREKIIAKQKEWYARNKERARAAGKARYEANKKEIIAQQREYIKRKTIELGFNPRTLQARKYRKEHIEQVRLKARAYAAQAYRDDPFKAAIKRAKTILAEQSGVQFRDVPADLAEAKALQLLVRKEVHRPGMAVGEKLTDDQIKARRAERWQRWYSQNKERVADNQRKRNGKVVKPA